MSQNIERVVLNHISLYEFVMLVSLFIFGISTKNVYVISIAAMLLLKQIPEKLLKKIILKDHWLNNRPSGAYDCNMINEGGSDKNNPGFPSGHTTVSLFLFTVAIIEFVNNYKSKYGKNPSMNDIPILIYILGIFAIAVPIARIRSQCHTSYQVLGGAILGVLIGIFYCSIIDKKWLSKYSTYNTGKERFISLFM